jgi:hypothetical protein
LLLFSAPAVAQDTALDFTVNDCDGIEHHLFADLDAGYAVIIDLVMMGCQPCIDATHALVDDVIPNTQDPSMVKLYTIGYTNSISCSQINNWKTTNGFEHEVFAGMSAQTTYYGGMGMPTIVILGGDQHNVYYNNLGYNASQNPTLIAALNNALSGASSIGENAVATINIHPNPATDEISIDSDWQNVQVTDLQGRVLMNTARSAKRSIDISALPTGAYILLVETTDRTTGTARFEKR